ncbi:MAG: signal peptidase I [Alphaproteobacteria bacterium]|nr:signal peptidase I [Alphaproteobacteria bacterium]
MNIFVIIYILGALIAVDYCLRLIRGRGFFSHKVFHRAYWLFFFADILLLVFAFRIFLAEPFIIPSSSMVPNLLVGDYIVVSKMSYGYGQYSFPFSPFTFGGRIFGHEIKRGDVVVFRYPPNPKQTYVKRIVGLPGDTLQVKDGILFVNGAAVPRTKISDYLMDDNDQGAVSQFEENMPRQGGTKHYRVIEVANNHGGLDNTALYTVPADHYFGMGDNRDNSADSRVLAPFGVGYIPRANIIGRVMFVLFSINKGNERNFLGWSTRWNRFFHPVK